MYPLNIPLWRPQAVLAALVLFFTVVANGQDPLTGAQPLRMTGDFSAQMVAGIGRFLEAETRAAPGERAACWKTDFASREAYEKSVAANRERFARMIGVVDVRVARPEMELVATVSVPAKVAETERFTVSAVRWPVLDGVWAEGLWLQPKGRVIARVVAIPDADQTPEMISGIAPGRGATSQYARRLAEQGCEVLVPTILDRADTHSGNPAIGRRTNQPHREWIYRQSYEMGRHVIGLEVQKILAAVDWLARDAAAPGPRTGVETRRALADRAPRVSIGVAGWGEGGLLALYSAALEPRIAAAAVSGYFSRREELWREPIYRNVFGLLREFGDAEIAQLIVPRGLVVEPARAPDVSGPPAPRAGFAGAAPGRIATPQFAEVRAEVARAQRLAGPFAAAIALTNAAPDSGSGATEGGAGFVSDATLAEFLRRLAPADAPSTLAPPGTEPRDTRPAFDPAARQGRQVAELQRFTQSLLPRSHAVRENFLWKQSPVLTPAAWQEAMRPYREKFWSDVIGRFPSGKVPPNPRTRPILDRPAWIAHEVVLDVLPEVFAWGYLLLPKNLKPGERRPVVVAQHGLEGLPADVINEDPTTRTFGAYKAFAARLAERGFIVFAPHNPYRGEEAFRLLQRKANPLGKSLFSIILAQHEAMLAWLATQPHVDPARIGFYGLSYGGKTAMRVPALLAGYALSICSADFNEWIGKNVTTEWTGSYLFSKEWEMPEWDLGNTFGYAEMAALIAPRPFMVERGHDDGVGIDEWVAFEFAKVNRLYVRLKIPERTRIEFFPGPHTIHGVGTFKFLHEQLGWPEP